MATSPRYAETGGRGPAVAFPGRNALAATPELGAAWRIGFGLLLVDAFLTTSRSLEILGLDFGLSLPYVATAIHVLTFLLACIAGGARRLATTRTGIFLILFTGWMMISTPFSSWRTGSVQTILYNWLPSLGAFFATGLLSSVGQCRKYASVMALSGGTIAFVGLLVGGYNAQRFSFNSGTLGNANDLSLLLLLAVPFFLVPLLDPASSRVAKLLASIGGLLVLKVNFSTGSRAGFISLLAILLGLLLTSSMIGKLKLAAGIIALATLLVAFVPSYSLYRYATIFNEPDSPLEIRSSEAYGSSQLRKELLHESMIVTLEHPLFGVGPGVYAPAMAKEAERQGKYAHWLGSHNAYTQVSSEMGFPGLIFYLAATLCAYLDILWARKHTRKDPSRKALALGVLLSLVGLNVNFFFSSNAYMAWLPILFGLSAALRVNLERDLSQQASAALPASAPRSASSTTPSLGVQVPVPSSATTPVYTYRFLGRPRRIRR